jgi:peptidoglycan hydrolase CwlO-like protein
LASIEKEYAATKENILDELEVLKSQHTEEMNKLAKAHEEELAKAKEDQAAAVKTAKALQDGTFFESKYFVDMTSQTVF